MWILFYSIHCSFSNLLICNHWTCCSMYEYVHRPHHIILCPSLLLPFPQSLAAVSFCYISKTTQLKYWIFFSSFTPSLCLTILAVFQVLKCSGKVTPQCLLSVLIHPSFTHLPLCLIMVWTTCVVHSKSPAESNCVFLLCSPVAPSILPSHHHSHNPSITFALTTLRNHIKNPKDILDLSSARHLSSS